MSEPKHMNEWRRVGDMVLHSGLWTSDELKQETLIVKLNLQRMLRCKDNNLLILYQGVTLYRRSTEDPSLLLTLFHLLKGKHHGSSRLRRAGQSD